MKTKHILFTAIATLLTASSAQAADGTWTDLTSGDNWNTPGSWLNGIIADGSGLTANFNTLDLTTDLTVHLDGPHTLGNLIFGDTAVATPAGWTLDNSGSAANILTLAGATPNITVNALGTGKTAAISAELAGSAGLLKAGAGTLDLSGVNTYTGTTTLSAGTLNLAFNAGGAPVSNILNPADPLLLNSLATSNLTINGANGVSNTQAFGGLTVAGVATSNLFLTSGTSGSVSVNLGAVNVASGRLNLALPASGTVTTSNADGLLRGATFIGVSGGAAVAGSARFLTINTGTISKVTETAAATNAALTDAAGTANYVLAAASGTTGTNLSANTIAFNGGTAGNTNPNGSFTVNGLMNSGSLAWTIGSAAGTGTVTIGSTQTLQLVNINSGVGMTVNANIVDNSLGASSIYKTGLGTVTLAGTNTFSGGITIGQGTLTATSVAGLGSGPIFANSFYGSAYTSAGTPFLSISASGAVNVANNIVLPAPSSTSYYGIQKSTVGSSIELSGIISGGNANTVFQLDTPNGGDSTTSYTLSGTNTLAGTLRLNRGTVTLTNASAAGTADLFIQSNANANGNLIFSNSFTLPNNVTITTGGDAISTGTNDVTLSGLVTIAVAWPKAGTGKLTLTNAGNLLTGATTVSAGTLSVGGAGRLNATGTYAGNIILTAATSTLDYASSAAQILSGVISGAGKLNKSGTSVLTLAGTNTFNGGITVSQGTIAVAGGLPLGSNVINVNASYGTAYVSGGTPFLAVTGAGAQIVSNNIVLASPGSTQFYGLQKTGGSLNLSGIISGGSATSVLQLDSPTAGDSTTAVTLSGTNTLAGTIRLNRGTLTLTNASAAGTASLFLQSNPNANGNLLFSNSFTLANNIVFGTTNGNAISTGANEVTISGAISGPANWTKTGIGNLTLSNPANPATGTITVANGTLFVTGSITGGATVSGGTLSGLDGTLGATTVTAGGTLAPGPSLGTLNFSGSLTLGGTAAFEIDKLGPILTSDRANLSAGTLTLGGTLTVTATGSALELGDSFDLFNAPAFSGSFTTYNLPLLDPGLDWNTSNLGVDGTLTVVPEPGAALSLLGGLGLLLGRRRWRA